MALLGTKTSSALGRFERDPLVCDIRVFWDRIRVSYSTGIHEHWSLDHGRPRRLVLPRTGWWRHEPRVLSEHATPCDLLFGDGHHDGSAWILPHAEFVRAGFMDRRLAIQRAVARLLAEGWIEPVSPDDVLDADLDRLQRAPISGHVVSPGFVRQQVDGMGAPPAGMAIALAASRWGDFERDGRPSLRSSYTARRIYWAIEQCLARKRNVTRVSVIHALICGPAFGVSSKIGPRLAPPSFWRAVFQRVCGVNKPIVGDIGGCPGSVAAAVVAERGRLLHAPDWPVRDQFAAWALRHGVVVERDSGCTVDIGLLGDIRDLEEHEASARVGDAYERCATVLAVASRDSGEAIRRAHPQLILVRFRRWKFDKDDLALLVLHQA